MRQPRSLWIMFFFVGAVYSFLVLCCSVPPCRISISLPELAFQLQLLCVHVHLFFFCASFLYIVLTTWYTQYCLSWASSFILVPSLCKMRLVIVPSQSLWGLNGIIFELQAQEVSSPQAVYSLTRLLTQDRYCHVGNRRKERVGKPRMTQSQGHSGRIEWWHFQRPHVSGWQSSKGFWVWSLVMCLRPA